MNATLQCLLHIPELNLYFLNEYPKDKNILNNINIESESKGKLSEAYYDVIKNIQNFKKNKNNERLNSFAPRKFKEVLGKYNSQFSKNEANDSKDLITYLLQTFHSELNYFGDKKAPTNLPFPDSSNRDYTYTYFCNTYNFTNFSKISQLFYGTYENITICSICGKKYYSFQKFEIISFSTYFYRKEKFDIMYGFKDIEKIQKLEGDNKYYCNNCNKLVNAEAITKILELPNKLILNIDYGRNKVHNVAQLDFEDEIDLKDYLSIYFRQNTKFRLCSICTHIGKSGMTGHYKTYCLDKNKNIWYKFNDSWCDEVKDKSEMKKNSPYLLIYELVL
jgi:ubiquitin C-terminal hydrolase